MTVITLTTDFGLRDSYVAIMKGVILSICPSVRIIDISHEVRKFDVLSGAFILASAFSYFPKGTIHVGVVDPGVGTERKAIAIKTKNYFFIGPDNGLLTLASKIDGIVEIRLIENEELFLQNVSSTFHGRDIFAPVAAHLARTGNFSSIGRSLSIDEIVIPPFSEPIVEKEGLLGRVIHIDDFGNIITNIHVSHLKNIDKLYGRQISIEIKDKKLNIPFVKSFGRVPIGHLLCFIDSFNFLEISINQGNASKFLNVKVGDTVKVFLGE